MALNKAGPTLAYAARAATPAAIPLNIGECSGLLVVVDLTAFVTAADLRPRLQLLTPAGNALLLYQADATHNITATGAWGYLFYPMGLEAANTELTGIKDRVSHPLPSVCQLAIMHQNGNSHTYGVQTYYLV